MISAAEMQIQVPTEEGVVDEAEIYQRLLPLEGGRFVIPIRVDLLRRPA